ncbi:RNA polymerase sigma-70 factor [Olivibacter sp. SDN3]|uniref:RNA polymerase sigma factor n=1 Tax=Olivibacter sp. SDN3 TaxID=2764720 RepID=UPI0016515859|nr:RNA polymerase sigma-70 factor [Olivibacter sp. SDN3]QNL48077.1 RNA polymerase sigma-70 factor [Olivibacter sp. SDN3]
MAKMSYESYDDSELIRLILSDDYSAYMEIYERYSRQLYAHACKKLNDRDEVKDLLQEVFAALWQNRSALNPESPLAGYLYATLRYKIIKLIAHKKVEAVYFESLATINTQDNTTADYLIREKELGQLIESEIVRLPEKMQEVFRMSRQSHLSHKEIADELGLSETTVKKHVNNALKILRPKFGTLISLAYFLLR